MWTKSCSKEYISTLMVQVVGNLTQPRWLIFNIGYDSVRWSGIGGWLCWCDCWKETTSHVTWRHLNSGFNTCVTDVSFPQIQDGFIAIFSTSRIWKTRMTLGMPCRSFICQINRHNFVYWPVFLKEVTLLIKIFPIGLQVICDVKVWKILHSLVKFTQKL
jgi:hypothetical protein